MVVDRLWPDQITCIWFPEFPCSFFHQKKRGLIIFLEVSATPLLQPWQVPDIQKNDTAKQKKKKGLFSLSKQN